MRNLGLESERGTVRETERGTVRKTERGIHHSLVSEERVDRSASRHVPTVYYVYFASSEETVVCNLDTRDASAGFELLQTINASIQIAETEKQTK